MRKHSIRAHVAYPARTFGLAVALLLNCIPLEGARAADFRDCLAQVRAQALASGVSAQTYDATMSAIEPDPSVLEAMRYQPEFTIPPWDYLAGLVDDQRIADGRARLEEWAAVLSAAERQFGVDRHTIVAVWGVESDFGRLMGTRPLLRSLATVSCEGSRQRFFRGELIATLKIVESGDFAPEALRGSWAGAFGQTQFMPSTFLRLAVDFDGDGRRDIVGSAADALGSTANYLKRAGWVKGEPWGFEVRLPADYKGPSGRRQKQSLGQWAALGLKRVDGKGIDGPNQAGLLLPAGTTGPAFLVLRNFDAIYSYNASDSYALAIAHLADRLRGGTAFAAPWPTDDRGLSRAERQEVQQRLIDRGYDIGAADGMIGARTRAAIREFQRAAGLADDGRAGGLLLEALRNGK